MHIIRVVEAYVTLLLVDALMWRGTGGLYEVLRPFARLRTPWHASSHDACLAAVEEAAIWYVHRVYCLQRSAALWIMLRIRGVPVHLVIGFRPIPFESHAWVERDAIVINDRQQYQRFFTVLDRL